MPNVNTQIDTRMDKETISALMDGQLNGARLSVALRGTETAEARENWLLYHLVGDVLRSSELARGSHNLAFAERVSQRLGESSARPDKPAAATSTDETSDTRRTAANDSVFRWRMVAGLASFVAVAAIGWGVLGGAPVNEGSRLAQSPVNATGGAAQVATLADSSAPAVAPLESPAEEPAMWRDPRLDELLAAHRTATDASMLGSTVGFLRNATFEGAGR
jgi:sigma-E factor negative regulatory protein RseA